jgi:hypothetical protein
MFSEMAYAQLEKTYPEIMTFVATFKIIKSDYSDEQFAPIGVFIVLINNLTIYIPAVLKDSNLFPLDIMFVKEENKFYPFNKQWVETLTSSTEESMGQVDTTQRGFTGDRAQDQDIRKIMIPPRTLRRPVIGMSTYASSKTASIQDAFLNFLDELPNDAKKAVADTFKSSVSCLKYAAENYDMQDIIQALTFRPESTQEKTASETSSKKVFVLSKDRNTHEELVKICEVFPTVAKDLNNHGVSILDLRRADEIVNRVQRAEDYRFFTAPNEGGLFRVFLKNGESKPALVFPKVNALHWVNQRGGNWDSTEDLLETFLVVFEDGSYTFAKKMMANKIPVNKNQLNELVTSLTNTNPGIGDKGTWVTHNGGSLEE